jgi:putative transposase
MLHWLGIKPSYSRARGSEDNAYAEALFHTGKLVAEFSATSFEDLNAARILHCYNTSSIVILASRYVTLAQRHAGDDRVILAVRQALYAKARASNPVRWSRNA